jgi:hypothetical protein
LPDRPTVLELGAGGGSLFRWLAPIIGRDQHWIWLDGDEDLLEHGIRGTAMWARRLGYQARQSEDATELTVKTPRGTWTIETRVDDLQDPSSLRPIEQADAVACSALLDLLSEAWLDELLRATRRCPFYAAISVNGADAIAPHRVEDALVWRGYHRDQVGNSRLTDPLGPDVEEVTHAICAKVGREWAVARSDWRIRPRHRAMLRFMIGFLTNAAHDALPQHRRRVDRWKRRRHEGIEAGRLAMRIGHSDILVFPEGGPPNAARRRSGRLHRGD